MQDINDCYVIIKQLHTELTHSEYLKTMERLSGSEYKLVALYVDGVAKSVAGFHIGESFAWKKYLYVDDMVTDEESRSRGFGEKLLSWIEAYAAEAQCEQLHLDSRVIRHGAHKFYMNYGLIQGGYHFHKHL